MSNYKKVCTILKNIIIIEICWKNGGTSMFDNIKEECGVFGVYSKKPEKLAYITCVGLSGLQHRGEESCRNCSKHWWSN